MAQRMNGVVGGIADQDVAIEIDVADLVVEDPDISDCAQTLVMRRVRVDSLSPTALPAAEPALDEPLPWARKRSMPMVFAAGMAAGIAAILAVGGVAKLLPSAAPQAAPVAAAAAPAEHAIPTMPAQDPPAAQKAEPPTPAQPAEAPKQAEAPKKQATAKAAPAPQPAAPKAPAERASAAPVSTSDFEPPVIPPMPKPASREIDRSAVAVAIASAGMRASACRDGDSASMSVPVTVTFLPTGRAARASVNGGPFAGTAVGSCIAGALRSLTVPAFDGEAVNVSTSIRLQ